MPPIKITLPRLIEMFGKSVNSDLPDSVRALAARLMTLTAHVVRIDQKVDARVKALSEQISQLTDIIQALAQPQQAAPAAAAETAPSAAAAQPVEAPAPTNEAPAEEASEEEEDEAAFFARAQQEAEAEVAAINANLPPEPAPVAVLPRSKKAGGAK